MTGLSARLDELPLPLARLVRRAENGKSAVERHHNAFYFAECALKLASAIRVGVWLEHAFSRQSPLVASLQSLALPSTGHWLELLRETSADLSRRADADTLPVVPHAELVASRRWESVKALAARCVQHGVVAKEVASRAQSRGVLGLFELIVPYRNEVIGHGALRSSAFYDDIAEKLFAALDDLVACPALFGEGFLAVAHAERGAWTALRGLTSTETRNDAAGAEVGKLHFVTPRGAVLLDPLVVREKSPELGTECVGFLNRTVRRRGGAAVRRVDYLDYESGQSLGEIDTRAAVSALLGRLSGGDASTVDLEGAMARAANNAAPERETGETIGAYELLSELGRGAMGIVYKARHTELGRIVALKVLPESLGGDDDARTRFAREIRALVRCDHPNVVKILASGEDDGRLYYAMEYVEGSDLGRAATVLSKWRGSKAPLTERHLALAASRSTESDNAAVAAHGGREEAPRPIASRLAELFAEAASGLAHIHEQGILHRDVKPANLMLTSDGRRIVIMDLGLAKLRDESRALTAADVKIVGTLRYMAPEQLQRQLLDLDARADVYGLGASLYEIATGRPPFDGDSEQRLIQQVLNEDPKPARVVDRAVPRDLSVVIEVAMSKSRDRRYASASDMAADLRNVAGSLPIRARPPGVVHRLRLWSRRHRAIVAVIATGLPLLMVAGWAFARGLPNRDAAFTIRRFDDELDTRDWKPYVDANAKTSPVRRHIRFEIVRATSKPVDFIERASTMSPLGLDCDARSANATCEEELPSTEPPRRTWLLTVPADAFTPEKPTVVAYDVGYWNSYRFDLGDKCQACDISKQFVYPVDDYRLTIRFAPGRIWKSVACLTRKDGDGTVEKPRRTINTQHADVFVYEAKAITPGPKLTCHIYVE